MEEDQHFKTLSNDHVTVVMWQKLLRAILVKTSASFSAQALSTQPGMPTGPVALRAFTLLEHKSLVESVSSRSSGSSALVADSVFL